MIEMKKISKSFGANLVLNDVDLELNRGEVLALLGENGAGKSTLMNILGGVHTPDSGSIVLDDKAVTFNIPLDSLNSGIAFIHQELNLINDLPVYENMFLGNEIMKGKLAINKTEMIKRTQEMFDKLDIELDPCTMVSKLDASYKQIVEITRALMMDANYIIMDEPTTSLTGPEIERVFKMVDRLRKDGVGIIFISHKLDEVMEICDRFVVLRNGKMVANDNISSTNPKELARHMVGHDVKDDDYHRETKHGDVILEVKNLSNEKDFKNINFSVKAGEVLGITGLLGDGRSELFQTIFGDLNDYTGDILVEGKTITIKSIQDAMAHDIAYVPRNRKENGIISDLSILENGTMTPLKKYASKLGIINTKKQTLDFNETKSKLNLKMGKHSDLITSLSGGNQQKVVLMKWLLSSPKVLILDNPTQGVDVGAKEEIYDIIHALADTGVAVVMLSNEAQEIIRTCDRALVMYHGHIQGECDRSQMNEHTIMELATGGNNEISEVI